MNRPEDQVESTVGSQQRSEKPDNVVRLAQAMNEYLEALETGQGPDREALRKRYPDIADELSAALEGVDFIQNVAPQLAEPLQPQVEGSTPTIQPRLSLGDFRVVRQIGKGGMGVVYEAEQLSLGRRVALKVLPFAAVLEPKQVQRFRNEAHAAAQLHHQNIVPVYSVGSERGVHYYAMQYIEGQTLAELIRDLRQLEGVQDEGKADRDVEIDTLVHSLASGRFEPKAVGLSSTPTAADTRHRSASNATAETVAQVQAAIPTEHSTKSLAYFRSVAHIGVSVAHALDHAHQHGVVHRDVKPSNVILDIEGKPWITDFGLAHMETGATLTISGDLLDTVRYMSPEQALAKRVVLDHRTDIYSLGVTLYELLTLQPAFDGQGREQLLRQIAFEEPRSPRRLNKLIPHELETIVLKATAKNPNGRYGTAQEMADDLNRFLEHKPILARRPSLLERSAKWSRRHRAVTWSVAVAIMTAVVALAVSTILISRAYDRVRDQRSVVQQEKKEAIRQRQEAKVQAALAKQQRDDARGNLYVAQMRLAQQDWEAGRVDRLYETLESAKATGSQNDLRGWEWYYLLSLCYKDSRAFRGHCSAVDSVAWSPDGTQVAYGTGRGWLRICDATTGEEVHSWQAHRHDLMAVAWNSDGQRIASGAQDRTTRVWNVLTEQQVHETVHSGAVYDIEWSPDDSRLAAAGQSQYITISDAATGKELRQLRGHRHVVYSLDWSPDSQRLVSGGKDGVVRIWDLSNAQETLADNFQGAQSIAWSLDGRHLAVSPFGRNEVTICKPSTGEIVQTLRGGPNLAWSPDSRSVAILHDDGTITISDAISGESRRSLDVESKTSEIQSSSTSHRIAWSPNGTRLAVSYGLNNTIVVFDASNGQSTMSLTDHDREVWAIRWSPTGDRLASADWSGKIKIWESETGELLRTLSGTPGRFISALAWSPDGERLASGGFDQMLRIWSVSTGDQLCALSGHKSRMHSLEWSPDGSRLVSTDATTTRIRDSFSGRE